MTIGENIRRIRKMRGLTLRQLGEEIGVSEAYIRAYESGRRNPKQQKLEDIANALHVNVETLTGADFDGVKAMHRLFQIFRQYPGEIIEYQNSSGEDRLAVSFDGLFLMYSWFERYEKYQKEIEECNKIKDPKEKENALLAAEESFNLWMDIYPENETWLDRLKFQKTHDEHLDQMGLDPKNPE
ncbi:helix-turn-helix domain-containing protein [Lachnospiraceae bacterium C1.1]|nr:helix-turn-helix transcriptional regulator [Lachnospiraceae bacterium C1.1]